MNNHLRNWKGDFYLLKESSDQAEQQFETEKKQALQMLAEAAEILQQATHSNLAILPQSSQKLQQAVQLINQMQGIAVTKSPTTTQQQLEQVRQQIEQAAQTLQLVHALNSDNQSFKKG